MCTKAVHLKVVTDLSTSAFIAAFRRFTARRGFCHNIYSDYGTNFVGAKNSMYSDMRSMQRQATKEMAEFLTAHNTQWHFNPPASPHFGGLWEAGVKSVKYHLKRVTGTSSMTFEEYATLLAQIEACLNSRPLCPMSNNPEDLTVLTPCHFLIGEAPFTSPEIDVMEVNINNLNRWKYI